MSLGLNLVVTLVIEVSLAIAAFYNIVVGAFLGIARRRAYRVASYALVKLAEIMLALLIIDSLIVFSLGVVLIVLKDIVRVRRAKAVALR